MAGNHTLGTIRGTIEIDYDGAGIVRAVKDTTKAKKSFGDLDKASSKTLTGFKAMSKGALGLVGAVGTAYNVVTLLSSAVAALAPVVTASLAAAPAVVLGFASAMIIAKVAVAGVGDAMSAASEGGKKFDEAMAKLSPQAQKFVRQYRSVIPVLEGVKKRLQDAFFGQLSKGQSVIAKVVKVISAVQRQAQGIAGAMGAIVRNIVVWVSKASTIKDIRAVLSGVNAFLLKIRTSIGPVVAAFINLAAQGSAFAGVAGGKVATALQSLADWMNRLDIGAIFAKAMPILSTLADLFWDIVFIVGNIFSIFNVDGANALGTLGTMVATLASFLETADGEAVLQALGAAIQAVAGAASTVFMAALQAITPILIALTPAIVQLSEQISGFLVPAIQTAGPILASLAGFMADNMTWITPLVAGVGALAAAYKVYSAVAKGVAAVQAFLALSAVKSTAAWIANTASIVANRVAQAAMAVVQGVVKAATVAYTAVQWLLNVALTANPIGLVIAAIALLIVGIILLWKKSETFRTIVLAVWNAIKIAAMAVANWFMTKIVPSLKRAWDMIVAGVKFLVRIWMAQWTITRNVVTTVWNWITNVIKKAIQNIKNTIATIKAVITVVRNAFNQVNTAIANALRTAVSWVKGLPGRITAALGNLGSLLYSKGKSLVEGFINGISNMIGRVRDKAREVVSAVTDFLPGSPAKEGPLSGRGYALLRARRMMADFSKGLADGADGPVSVMMSAVTPMSRAMAPAGSGARSGVSTVPGWATPVASGRREYNVAFGNRAFAKMVVDAITGEPVAVSKAANEGSRKTAWSGSGR